jgi:dienelactone hydrolase
MSAIRWRSIGSIPAAALAVALAACAGIPGAPPDAPHGAHPTARRTHPAWPTAAIQGTWSARDAELDLVLVAPAQPDTFPLVVYLPGLGEPETAGWLWRQAWAEAGYAVLSIQSRTTGQAVWASAPARAGDFRALAASHFAPERRRQRLAELDAALAQFAWRAARGKEPYASADLQRIALAGYDLGAWTAAALWHEPDLPYLRAHVAAVISLSPSPEPAGRALGAPFNAAVLMVTGTEDTDPFGVVKSPGQRLRAWHDLPPGDHYLLTLIGGSHAALAGSSWDDGGYRAGGKGNPGDARDTDSPRRAARPHASHSDGNAAGTDPPRWRMAGQHGAHAEAPALAPAGAPSSGRLVAMPFNRQHIAAVQAITTAFLDATLLQEPQAQQWLRTRAADARGAVLRLEHQ